MKDPDLFRWIWQGGEWGVHVNRAAELVWHIKAWSPTRRVVLNTKATPTDIDIAAAARLAGFTFTRRGA